MYIKPSPERRSPPRSRRRRCAGHGPPGSGPAGGRPGRCAGERATGLEGRGGGSTTPSRASASPSLRPPAHCPGGRAAARGRVCPAGARHPPAPPREAGVSRNFDMDDLAPSDIVSIVQSSLRLQRQATTLPRHRGLNRSSGLRDDASRCPKPSSSPSPPTSSPIDAARPLCRSRFVGTAKRRGGLPAGRHPRYAPGPLPAPPSRRRPTPSTARSTTCERLFRLARERSACTVFADTVRFGTERAVPVPGRFGATGEAAGRG